MAAVVENESTMCLPLESDSASSDPQGPAAVTHQLQIDVSARAG